MVIALIVKVAYMNARDMREREDMACMWHEDDKHNIEEEICICWM